MLGVWSEIGENMQGSVVIGKNNQLDTSNYLTGNSWSYSVILGSDNTINGSSGGSVTEPIVLGRYNTLSGTTDSYYNMIFGWNSSTASRFNTVSFGRNTDPFSDGQVVFGQGNSQTYSYSLALGKGDVSEGNAPTTNANYGSIWVDFAGDLNYLDTAGVTTQLNATGGISTIAAATDTTITSPSTGDFLIYGGTTWDNGILESATLSSGVSTSSVQISGGTV